MTVATHVYTAKVGTVDLSPLECAVGLDASRAPHVQGTLRVPVVESLMDDLDPRQSPAPRVVVTSGGRVFNLAVVDRAVAHRAAEVTLSLASDEALLSGYAPLTDDWHPLTIASSLRAVVNYVLGEAIPGAALAASPAHDVNVTPFWQVSNLMPNPAARAVVGNWIAGGAAGALSRETGWPAGTIPGAADVTTAFLTTWTGNSGLGQGGAFPQTATVAPFVSCQPFTRYTVSVWVLPSVAKPVRLLSQVYGSDGQLLNGGVEMPFAVYNTAGAQIAAPATTNTIPAGVWSRLVATITTPENAARLAPFLYPGTAVQWVNGNTLRSTAWMVHEGVYPTPIPYFDGATPASGQYTYSASGAANASASSRIPTGDPADPESLLWRAGQSALEFLHPLLQTHGLRLVCDEARVWTLRADGHTEPGTVTIREGINLIEGTERIDRAAGVWFDARVVRYKWTDRAGAAQERVDAHALTPDYTNLTTLDLTTPYPGPGRAQYAVERAQGIGREVTATAQADWSARAEEPVSLTLPATPLQVGNLQAVRFDLDRNEMTVTARTTDVGAGSINALTGTINALPGTINGL